MKRKYIQKYKNHEKNTNSKTIICVNDRNYREKEERTEVIASIKESTESFYKTLIYFPNELIFKKRAILSDKSAKEILDMHLALIIVACNKYESDSNYPTKEFLNLCSIQQKKLKILYEDMLGWLMEDCKVLQKDACERIIITSNYILNLNFSSNNTINDILINNPQNAINKLDIITKYIKGCRLQEFGKFLESPKPTEEEKYLNSNITHQKNKQEYFFKNEDNADVIFDQAMSNQYLDSFNIAMRCVFDLSRNVKACIKAIDDNLIRHCDLEERSFLARNSLKNFVELSKPSDVQEYNTVLQTFESIRSRIHGKKIFDGMRNDMREAHYALKSLKQKYKKHRRNVPEFESEDKFNNKEMINQVEINDEEDLALPVKKIKPY